MRVPARGEGRAGFRLTALLVAIITLGVLAFALLGGAWWFVAAVAVAFVLTVNGLRRIS